MRILLLPEVYTANPLNSSCVNAMQDLVLGLDIVTGDAKGHMFLPEPDRFFRYEFPANTDQMMFHAYPSPMADAKLGWEPDWLYSQDWSSATGQVDTVLNARLFINPLVAKIFEGTSTVLISFFNDVWDVSLDKAYASIATVLASASSIQQVYTDDCKIRAIKLFRQSLSSQYLRELSWIVSPMPLDMTRLRPVTSQEAVLFYGGSSVPKKNIGGICDIAERLYRAKAIDTFLVAATGDTETFEYLNFAEIHRGLLRDQYYKLIQQGTVFLCLSEYEETGMSNWEQMLAGQVGVFLNRPWIYDFLPVSYPFVVNDWDEAYGLTFWISRNLQEAREMICPAINDLRVQLDHVHVAKTWLDAVTRVML